MSASLRFNDSNTTQKTITNISVSHAPDKTSYAGGEYFDPTGMTLDITYSNNTTETISAWTETQLIPLAAGATQVLINWNDAYLITYTLPQAENNNKVDSAKVGTAKAG